MRKNSARASMLSLAAATLAGCSLAGLDDGGDGGGDAKSGVCGNRSCAHDASDSSTDRKNTDAHSADAPSAAVRQTNRSNGSTVSTQSNVLNKAPLAGSLLAATVFANAPVAIDSVSGAGVETWNAGPSSQISVATMVTYWGITSGGPSDTVITTFASSVPYVEIYFLEITGVSTVDTERTEQGQGVTASVPLLTLAGADEVIVAQSALQGGPVSAFADHGFVDSYNPIGNGPGIFQSYAVLEAATTYTPETYTMPSGYWYTQAIAFKAASAQHDHD